MRTIARTDDGSIPSERRRSAIWRPESPASTRIVVRSVARTTEFPRLPLPRTATFTGVARRSGAGVRGPPDPREELALSPGQRHPAPRHGALRGLEGDQTLLVQSGKPVGILRTHVDAPRVLIANANLVPHWATQEHFDELAARGLIMYGQMTAGSYIYIGTQGILQGTYETFGSLARQRGWGSLKGKFVLTAGLGGMGGAQPLAITMNEGVGLIVEIDPARAQRRLEHRYVDVVVDELEEAMTLVEQAVADEKPLSVGLIGNAADVFPELAGRNVIPDVVTDQTPAHEVMMYVPHGMRLDEAVALRERDPDQYAARSAQSMARHVEAMLAFQRAGAEVFDYGNNLRQRAYDAGVRDAFNYPGFVPAYIRPLFCLGKGPFRWVALSGDPDDIYKTDQAVMELFPEDVHLYRWLTMAREKVPFQGLPARICWLGYGERAKVGLKLNEMVASGELQAPMARVIIGGLTASTLITLVFIPVIYYTLEGRAERAREASRLAGTSPDLQPMASGD